MKKPTQSNDEDQDSQLGGTDQIEQLAADIAHEEDHTQVTDEDRKKAVEQMVERSPAPPPKINQD
ncbi:hypothetical protein WJU23_11655 [Prosthecobacter sp. SYSU 5D2]|uniref:hypothetical protein n=1 Tax=Prosthecobacter sp. SYSU 5D2 TaxID=3134134 RepID=UPI0031FF12DD